MSFEKTIRELIRVELQAAIAPIAAAVNQLQSQDVGAQLRSLLTGGAVKRGPGRPRKVSLLSVLGGKPGKRGPKPKAGKGDRACAVIGCKRPHRSKGYCSSHYQKRRGLERTRRLPSDWVLDAKPATVKDIKLPRGRAASKALAAAKAKK